MRCRQELTRLFSIMRVRAYTFVLLLVAIFCFAGECQAYELTGRVEPAAAVEIFLQGADTPFQASVPSEPGGRFRFRKLLAGTYTVSVETVRGEIRRTVEVTAGTVDAKGRVEIVVNLDDKDVDPDGVHRSGITVPARVLSIPDRAVKEYDDAQRCLKKRDSDCAQGHLRKAVLIAPHFVTAWNELGVIAYQSRQYPEAEMDFRRALEADSEAFEPLVNLGGVLLNLGKLPDALAYNQRAVARRPENALANSQLGLTYFLLGGLDDAEKYLKIAVRLDPAHFSHPQLPLAEIYVKRGDRSAAVRLLREFLEQHPDSSEGAGVRREIDDLSR